jgi:hypothetical protein
MLGTVICPICTCTLQCPPSKELCHSLISNVKVILGPFANCSTVPVVEPSNAEIWPFVNGDISTAGEECAGGSVLGPPAVAGVLSLTVLHLTGTELQSCGGQGRPGVNDHYCSDSVNTFTGHSPFSFTE